MLSRENICLQGKLFFEIFPFLVSQAWKIFCTKQTPVVYLTSVVITSSQLFVFFFLCTLQVQEANWELYKRQRAADAELYDQMKQAEAQKASADAAFYALQQASEGELYAKKKQAEGIQAMAEAQGFYLTTLLKSLGGNYAALRDYIMLDKNMFQDIAAINAQAVNGLQPKISIWNNGGSADQAAANGNGGMKDIAGVYTMLPPLLKTVQEQTGMLPPNWLGTLADDS